MPAEFWEQTARSFSGALRARLENAKREARAEIVRSWNLAALVGAAFAGKLKPLNHYLASTEDKSRGGAALLGALMAMKKKGVPMTIERIRKTG